MRWRPAAQRGNWAEVCTFTPPYRKWCSGHWETSHLQSRAPGQRQGAHHGGAKATCCLSAGLPWVPQAEFGQRGSRPCLCDAQAHLRGLDAGGADQPPAADARPGSDLFPACVLPSVNRKGFHTLAEREVLTQTDHGEGDRVIECKDKLGGETVVTRDPIGVSATVDGAPSATASVFCPTGCCEVHSTPGQVLFENLVK